MPITSPFQRTPSPQRASWFLDLYDSGQLDLDPPYQRRSVWSLNYRQFFIDSVIRNYPTQSVFIEIEEDPDGPTRYRVLDGKQRITSLILFTQNEFSTPESLSDLGINDTYYSDLSKEHRKLVLSYLLTAEIVSDASPADLNQAFDRLNRNVARLNKQELRHAQYGGAFITKMEELADDTLWERFGVVTPARRRRMLDVEYVSEFYIAAAEGPQDGKDYLDRIYAEWDVEIRDAREADRKFKLARSYMEDLDSSFALAPTRYSNVADFYSLWCAILDLQSSQQLPDIEDAASRLSDFLVEIDDGSTPRALRYTLSARQGSNKASNRVTRAASLKQVMQGTR